ncbi:MAG: PKD domain-containing protein, partial [Bacteroidetes bacterium]
GQAPYEAIWGNGATGLTVSGLTAGTYAVTLTDGNGCAVSDSVVVSEPEALTCSAQVIQPVSTHGGSDGIAGGTAAGGVAPYTYLWSNGDEGPTADSLSAGQWHLTVTDANGCLCTTTVDMPQPASLGDFVWNDQNENGIQDSGEPGLPDVEITLEGTTSGGVEVNLTTQTDAEGRYRFNALQPGLYRLRFAPPDQYGFTIPNAANDQVDSDVDPATGMTETIAVLDGQENLTVDAGFFALDEPVTLGDFVWLDANRNGLQDSSETGIPGVVVRLLRMPGGSVQATTTTDFLGKYHFQNVPPGDYAIEFLGGSLPTGYVFTTPDAGADDALDSDVDPALGRIPTFTVVGYSPDDLTLDAGAYPACDNVTSGGQVGFSEQLCGMGADPAEIIELVPPMGGFGALEFQWLQSDIPVFNGPGDPNWAPIPGATQATYDPGPLNQTTYYIRCVRREGCTEFAGESNIVEKEIVELPLALIEQAPGNLCDGEPGTFKAANAGAGASYHWDFGSGTPSTADTRIVTGVSWSQPGTHVVTLTVTRFGCSQNTTALLDVNDCLAPLLRIEPFSATLEGAQVALRWQTGPAPEGTLFAVQRSEDGQAFHTIGMLSTASESEEGYAFRDTNPLKGLSWYRIGFQLPDGRSGHSEPRSVFFQPPGMPDFYFYPNPVGNHGRLDILNPLEEPLEVLLINGFGKQLRKWFVPAGASALEMDLSKWPQGVYYLQILAPGRRPLVQKV